MDESTFEMFDEELGAPLQEVPPQKPFRHARRTGTETYVQRRVREEPPTVHQIPKAVPRDAPISRAMPLRKAMSLQNVAQIEIPWEGVTLNRCLIIAITILVLTSGFQRLGEAIRGRKDGTDVDAIGTALNLKHSVVKKGRLPPSQPEPSLWDTFFCWIDDDDGKGCGKRGRSRTGAQDSAYRGLRHKDVPNRNLLKGRQDGFKARRGKARQQDDKETRERLKGQRAKEKRLKQKKLEEQEQEERKDRGEKIPKKRSKEGKKKDTKGE